MNPNYPPEPFSTYKLKGAQAWRNLLFYLRKLSFTLAKKAVSKNIV